MVVTLEEMKNYLRVDYDEDDALIGHLLESAEKICMDIIRTDDRSVLEKDERRLSCMLPLTSTNTGRKPTTMP